MRKTFHFRSFISFGLLLVIIYLLISGTVLFISPPGRVAHWQHWTFLGFSKEQWQTQHTLFSYLFVILGVFHIFFLNWKNMWSYVKLKSANQLRKKKEFISALAVFSTVFVGTYFEIPPLSSFYNLGKSIGFSWEERQRTGPIPHAENLTLKEISETYLKEDVTKTTEMLREKGITIQSADETMAEIASENGKSPAEIYGILTEGSAKSFSGDGGRGYGKMTLREAAEDIGLEVNEAISDLRLKGIAAKPNQTLKEIAEANGLHPSEIVRMLQIEH